jgi:uncharacterized membrane protein YhaH (DUF805 family)
MDSWAILKRRDWRFSGAQRGEAAMAFYLEGWKRYFEFSGRSRRSAFWFFVLFNVIIGICANVLDNILGTVFPSGTGALGTLYGLAALIPGLSVSVRRLHDTGRSGWWLLLDFVPIVGWIILIVWAAQDSQPGQNVYGANPKGMAAVAPA